MLDVRDEQHPGDLGARRSRRRRRKKKRLRRSTERSYTCYYRSIRLQAPVDKTKAKATYNNGVLDPDSADEQEAQDEGQRDTDARLKTRRAPGTQWTQRSRYPVSLNRLTWRPLCPSCPWCLLTSRRRHTRSGRRSSWRRCSTAGGRNGPCAGADKRRSRAGGARSKCTGYL